MQRVGLVLGGGGLVGIAWELGVMAGLRQHAGFEPAAMDLIVGTSAGSVAGAQVALGQDVDDLVERQRRSGSGRTAPSDRSDQPTPTARSGTRPTTGTTVVPDEIMRLLYSRKGTLEERARAVGQLALTSPVALEEDDYVESFRRMLGTDVWPDCDLRVTTSECDTGRSVLWTRHDGIDLVRAVASSCAIPGYFPTVAFGAHRYTDGVRGGFYADLVKEKSLTALLFIGPLGVLPEGLRANPEIDELAAGGLGVVQVTGGEALAAIAIELMDPAARGKGAEVGLSDGRDAAAEVAALLG